MFILFLVSPSSQMKFCVICSWLHLLHYIFIFACYSILVLVTKHILSDCGPSPLIFSYVVFFSGKAIDEYAALKSKKAELKDALKAALVNVDPRLEAIVERMLDKYVCFHLLFYSEDCIVSDTTKQVCWTKIINNQSKWLTNFRLANR